MKSKVKKKRKDIINTICFSTLNVLSCGVYGAFKYAKYRVEQDMALEEMYRKKRNK